MAEQEPSLESKYLALLSLAEGFRTNDPPDMGSAMQCLMAILNILPAGHKRIAKTNLQIGRLIVRQGTSAPRQHTDYARSYLEKSLQATRDHHGDPGIEEVKFEAASLLALVYEKQTETQAAVNLLRKCLDHSVGHFAFHSRLLFQLAQTYARLGDYSNAAAVLNSGAEYVSKSGTNPAVNPTGIDPLHMRILFLLSKGMMLMIAGNQQQQMLPGVRDELIEVWKMIESPINPSANSPAGNAGMQREGLKVFFLLLQVCHLLNCGQVKSVKTPLKTLQLSIQTMTQQQQQQQQPLDHTSEPGQQAGSGSGTSDGHFIWLAKEQMCILVYLVTVLHSMQSGYMDKAQKYTEKALMQIDSLRQGGCGSGTEDAADEEPDMRLLSTFQLILLEHMAMCRLVMGQRGLAIKETVQALHLCHRDVGLAARHKPVIQTLLGLYAMSMNHMNEAEKQLSAVLRIGSTATPMSTTAGSMISSDLRILCSLNLCIVYLRMGREEELGKLLSHQLLNQPDQLRSQSQSLKAAAFYVMGLNAFFKQRFADAKRFLRETLKIANSEDLNRLTACSLVLLGHIFYSLNSHRESMNMVTPAMQLASKIPDIQMQVWATALLQDLYRDENNHLRVEEFGASHAHFQQLLYQDQCQAAAQPEHEYMRWDPLSSAPSSHS